ncbi:glutamate synthase-related protein [Terriglobus roseus]|uniref:Glutamate synthase (NADPH/NADH) large chain n=1 Tax=Terriglobus roseus TaxID=392734 RepID=A0A1H4U1W5_9BACT|nr:glutamate synthase-related protein [Terriglobus roseus]SEC62736.1 glutamate synthase (NADPH/NADH) large chain [Terriglobus roseus]
MDTCLSTSRSEGVSARKPVRSLVDSRFDRDSCGVGFVADSGNVASHKVLTDALTALARLAHRGAVAADGKSSDGVGIMSAVPRALLLAETGVTLDDAQPLGVGVVFVREKDANTCVVLDDCLAEQGITVLKWRDVPVKPEILGEIALGTMPEIQHVLVTGAPEDFERKLYLARKTFERRLEAGEVTGYVASLSSKTMVYKSMCSGRLLPEFYPDLQNESFTTSFALFHQRYATNTTPAWHRAQPGRTLAHNGEINTVWGNRARMEARYSTLPAECQPILTKDGTDSTSLDETVELLLHNGRTVAEAIRVLLPPAVAGRESAFLKYHMDTMEPWDGPAALGFTDGRYVGAALDRNGLRPCRFAITTDGLVVAGSEAGLVDLDPETVIHSGRLGPGQMIVVDLQEKKIYENEQLLDLFDADGSYAALIDDTTISAEWVDLPPTDFEAIAKSQRNFGYTKEDVRMVLTPMATDGKDAVWSMGDDTPLAYLAKTPRPVYGYFRQRFAQVTNPAIDPLREAIVVSLHTRLGPWSHMLNKQASLRGMALASPFLSIGKLESLRQGKYPHSDTLRMRELKCVFSSRFSLEVGVEALCNNAVELVREGVEILLLSDRNADAELLPIPMAIAVSVVHHALVKAGLRTATGIAVEAGDVRDVHHAAVLIGYGAGAVCPWLALETARATAGPDGDAKVPETKMLKAFDAGLAKIMSKMGVSVVDSYRGAYPFDILGLSNEVVDRCFPNTPAPLGGAGFAEIEHGIRTLWGAPVSPDLQAKIDLPDYGWVKFRKADVAEPHAWQPSNVKALQSVVGSARNVALPEDQSKAFQIYSNAVGTKESPTVLRELLEIRPAGPELDLEKVEAPRSMMKRFIASAMSLGSLSPEAHTTITIAMNTIGGKSNTGEGGEDSDVYRPHPGNRRVPQPGEASVFVSKPSAGGVAVAEPMVEAPAVHSFLNNKIKQVASGRFGVTAEYLAHAEEIEIKVAQGAKPGEGGQLPGHKVTGLIARLRHAQPGVPLISPPPHHDIYSIEDLAELIHDLKRVNPRAAVGVKLVSSCGVGTVAAGVAKAYADYVVIAGNVGGTGAAALSSIKYAGNPWELGLAEAHQTLMANGMRGRVRLRTDGGLSTARDVLIAALLGADEYAFGTAVLVVLGCDMARQCHLNTCPTGIATQKPELRARFRGKPEHVVRFFEQLSGDLQAMLARYGLASIEDAIGRVDLLEQVRFDGGLDLSPMLVQEGNGPRKWDGIRNDRPEMEPALDDEWVAPAVAAFEKGESYTVTGNISNKDRAVGARIAGEISLVQARAESPMPVPDVTIQLTGTAGQSFGAFALEGMKLQLTGEANDFVGKGLSGGEIAIRARGLAKTQSGAHVLLGNVALYGATAGRLFAAGQAGERFAVRNSGATAVVAAVGDHGCEYMTGGTVVVLGPIGLNFGAGMTGGIAWLYDVDGTVLSETRYHADFLQAIPFGETDEAAQAELKALLEEHGAKSESTRAARFLGDWENHSKKFLRMVPIPQV